MDWKTMTLAVSLAAICGGAQAGPSKGGMWEVSGYQKHADGTSLPCETGSSCLTGRASDGTDFNKFCVPADALAPYAASHLAAFAQVNEFGRKNCKKAAAHSPGNREEDEMECDGVTIAQEISQSDDTHLSYSMAVKSPVDGALVTTLEMGASFVWLGDDCTGANGAIVPFR